MAEIFLTPEQWAPVLGADRVAVKDPTGRVVRLDRPGRGGPGCRVEARDGVRRAAIHGVQVQSRLKALEADWERTGGFDEAYAVEYVKRLDEQDPGHAREARPGQRQ